MNTKGILQVTDEMLSSWKPAFESTLGEGYNSLPESRKRLLCGVAGNAYAKLVGATEGDMSIMMPNNTTLAPNVLNPNAGGTGTAGGGTTGSADRQFLVGICVALAAKTIGLDLVQSVPVTSANVTVDHLNVIYNGGALDNAANDAIKAVTVEFDKAPALTAGQKYVLFKEINGTKQYIELTYVKQDRQGAKFHVFTVGQHFTATGEDTLSDVTYATEGPAIATIANSGQLKAIDSAMTNLTALQSGAVVKGVANTKAVENYIPNQTTKGFNRTLTRSEADAGTDHKVELSLTSTAHVVGNRTFNGNISRLELKRLKEKGIDPVAYLTAAMKNEISQELNAQIIGVTRAAGVSNHMAYNGSGFNFNTYIGPQSVASIPFANLPYAKQLVGSEGEAAVFPDIQNLGKTMQFETLQSLGTYLCMLISEAAYAIGTDSRFGEGDAVVLPSNLAGFVTASSKFTKLSDRNVTLDGGTGAKLAGYIDNIKVYVDVNSPMNSPYVTVLRTGNDINVDVPGVEDGNVLIPGYACLVKDLISTVELTPSGTGGHKIILDSEVDVIKIGEQADQGYITFAFYTQLPGVTN